MRGEAIRGPQSCANLLSGHTMRDKPIRWRPGANLLSGHAVRDKDVRRPCADLLSGLTVLNKTVRWRRS